MEPRVREFYQLLELHGCTPSSLPCQVCKHGKRGLAACFGEDLAASGGKYHLKRLWSMALSIGPGAAEGLWEEVALPGGVLRLSHLDGTIQLCRGTPAGPGAQARGVLADQLPPLESDKLRPSSRAQSRGSIAASSAAPAAPTAVTRGSMVEAEESEHEETLTLRMRPLGLEIGPRCGSTGAVVRRSHGQAAEVGVEVGSTILSVNEQSVEDLPTSSIQYMLDEESLPLTLDLRLPLNIPTVQQRKQRRRNPVTVSTLHCRGSHRVVSEAVARVGWQELEVSSDSLARVASVVWLEHNDSTEGLAPVQVVSRLEAFLHFCKKARLANCLNAWAEAIPEVFTFSPMTWILPYDADDLKAEMTPGSHTFIVKPTAGSQGRGITLAQKWKDVEGVAKKCQASADMAAERCRTMISEYVVQRYYEPLLLDGLKFDMRLYLVVTSVVPLRAYLFREGLARFCTKPYQAPTEANMQEKSMHLTNFSVNKSSKDFQPSKGVAQQDEGSKRSVSAVLQQIQRAFNVGSEDFWAKVAVLSANTLMAMRPGLIEFYVHEQPRPLHPLGPKGFQIIGLDVLIDSKMEPLLLELNANPSLSAVQPGGSSDSAGSPHDAPGSQTLAPSPGPQASHELERQPAVRMPSRFTGQPGGALPAEEAGSAARSQSRGRPSRHRSRARQSTTTQLDGSKERPPMVTSELDLKIKQELVAQALLLARPAPQSKVSRLRKYWKHREGGDIIPLDDSGSWALDKQPARAEAAREDAPDRCPALAAIDFEALAAPEVLEYAKAHMVLYRAWCRGCGQGRDMIGQGQVLKVLERVGVVGEGEVFDNRVAAQLWLSSAWRQIAPGSYGLTLPQFVEVAGRIGRIMAADGVIAQEADDPGRRSGLLLGVIEFARRVNGDPE